MECFFADTCFWASIGSDRLWTAEIIIFVFMSLKDKILTFLTGILFPLFLPSCIPGERNGEIN
jgi:hypothetical protein